MPSFDLLDRSSGEFAKRLRAVTDEHRALPTPCADFTVRDLVAHVVGGNRMSTVLLAGGSRDDALAVFRTDVLGSNWVEAYNGSYRTMYDAFQRPGTMNRTVHHPAFDMPASQLFEFRTVEYAVHGWDLARAIHADDTLNAELVTALWQQLEPMAETLRSSGVFGTGSTGTMPASAPLQARVLDLTGRVQ